MEVPISKDLEIANGSALLFEGYDASPSMKPQTNPRIVSIQAFGPSLPIAPQMVKPRQLSQDEWELLKPVLHLLYIEEDKTLDGVRRILRDKHHLFLT
jgi:hypothetical protein